ncbi:hypothetical protein JXJ21_13370 [candidate division KSB1 bacterium]|nr:hypothetical protein [candidate division KSB1 bacterium]
MKLKLSFTLMSLLMLFISISQADPNATTQDMFGLKMDVFALWFDKNPFDGVQMDTVRQGDIITINISFENHSDEAQTDFRITAFFPNRLEQYTKFYGESHPPASSVDSSLRAIWSLGELDVSEKGSITFQLLVENAPPEDTVYFAYTATAQAFGTPASEVAHTNIYVPGDIPQQDYPNLYVIKENKYGEAEDTLRTGDIVSYQILFNNSVPNSIETQHVVVRDTLPPGFTDIPDSHEFPEFMALDSAYTDDGRKILIWQSQIDLPYSEQDYLLEFKARAALLTDTNYSVANSASIECSTREKSYVDNRSVADSIYIQQIIDLALNLLGEQTEFELARNQSQSFEILCRNESSIIIPSATAWIKIDDGHPEKNIYSLSGAESSEEHTLLTWTFNDFEPDGERMISFTITLDSLTEYGVDTVRFSAGIDTIVTLPEGPEPDQQKNDNFASWQVTCNTMPNLTISIVPDAATAFNTDTRNFSITCENTGADAFNKIPFWVEIDDAVANDNIYSITSADDGLVGENKVNIYWEVDSLPANQRVTKSFSLTFDSTKLSGEYHDYPVTCIATVARLETDSLLWGDNSDTCLVAVDGTPDLSIEINGDTTYVDPGAILNFTVTCRNASSIHLPGDSIVIRVDLSKLESDSYTFLGDQATEGYHLDDNTRIVEWTVLPIPMNNSTQLQFSLEFMEFGEYADFPIEITAYVETSEDTFAGTLDGTPDLSISLIENSGKQSIFPNNTLTFTLTAKNSSSRMLSSDSALIKVIIDSAAGQANIYTLLSNAGIVTGNATQITWQIPPLARDDSRSVEFSLNFDRVEQYYYQNNRTYKDYPINIEGKLGTLILGDSLKKAEYAGLVDGTPDLAIAFEDGATSHTVNPNGEFEYTIMCSNLSCFTYESIEVDIRIDDGVAASNIYTLTLEGDTLGGTRSEAATAINWRIPPLGYRKSLPLYFQLAFDNIPTPQGYTINTTAVIDSVDGNASDYGNNSAELTVTIDAQIKPSLAAITIDRSQPQLSWDVEYTIPYANEGNFVARDAQMIITKPTYATLNYYTLNGRQNSIETTADEVIIELGDVPANSGNELLVGATIHRYVDLPDDHPNPISLQFSARLKFGEEMTPTRTHSVSIPIEEVVTRLVLDRNIVESGTLPLQIMFQSEHSENYEIRVYNLAGEFIKTIDKGFIYKGDPLPPFEWYGTNENGTHVASGVYLVYVESKSFKEYKKVILVK